MNEHVETLQRLLAELRMGIRRQKKVQERVDRRTAKGMCLWFAELDGRIIECDRSTSESGGGCGRCSCHYAELTRECMNKTQAEKVAIRNKAARRGSLLQQQEVRSHRKNLKLLAKARAS